PPRPALGDDAYRPPRPVPGYGDAYPSAQRPADDPPPPGTYQPYGQPYPPQGYGQPYSSPGYGPPPPPQGYGPPPPGYGRPYGPPPGEAYNDPRYEDPQPGSYSSREILDAGHNFFGSISKGLAGVVEYVFQRQGRPNGYILGQDAGGAFVAGVRYG